MGKTRKVDVAGRYGSRYGVGIRKRLLKVSARQKTLSACPTCGFQNVKRIAAGLFECRKCGAEFTGGAYEVETLPGKAVRKAVSQKAFFTSSMDLSKVKESSFADIEREVEKALLQEDVAVPMAEDFKKSEKKLKSGKPKKKDSKGKKKEGDFDDI
jgi:large subunit ribosomal protein L37Ae